MSSQVALISKIPADVAEETVERSEKTLSRSVGLKDPVSALVR